MDPVRNTYILASIAYKNHIVAKMRWKKKGGLTGREQAYRKPGFLWKLYNWGRLILTGNLALHLTIIENCGSGSIWKRQRLAFKLQTQLQNGLVLLLWRIIWFPSFLIDHYFLQINKLFLRAVLELEQNWAKCRESSHILLVPIHAQPSPWSTFPITGVHLLQSMTFMDTSLFPIGAHSCGSIFCGFWQTCNNMYPPL